jgi:hypothetical protein
MIYRAAAGERSGGRDNQGLSLVCEGADARCDGHDLGWHASGCTSRADSSRGDTVGGVVGNQPDHRMQRVAKQAGLILITAEALHPPTVLQMRSRYEGSA